MHLGLYLDEAGLKVADICLGVQTRIVHDHRSIKVIRAGKWDSRQTFDAAKVAKTPALCRKLRQYWVLLLLDLLQLSLIGV